MQDKVIKTGKQGMQTQFILVRPLLVPTSSPQATHLRFRLIKTGKRVMQTQCNKFEISRKLKTYNARNQDKYLIISNQYKIKQ